jgi:hypothetical protein
VEEGERSAADVVYGDCVKMDRQGRVMGIRPQHPFSRVILRLYGPFPESVSLISPRTSLGEDPWDPSLRTVMDWDLYLGLAAEGASFHYAPYPIGAFRQHEGQASHRAADERRGTSENVTRSRPADGRSGPGTCQNVIRKLAAGSYRRQLRGRSKASICDGSKERNGVDTFPSLAPSLLQHTSER